MSNSGEAEYLGAGNKGWVEDELLGGLITELVDRIWGLDKRSWYMVRPQMMR